MKTTTAAPSPAWLRGTFIRTTGETAARRARTMKEKTRPANCPFPFSPFFLNAPVASGEIVPHPGGAPEANQRIGFHSLVNVRSRTAMKTRLTSHVASNCGYPT